MKCRTCESNEAIVRKQMYDYTKPKDIIYLCDKCYNEYQEVKKLNEDENETKSKI